MTVLNVGCSTKLTSFMTDKRLLASMTSHVRYQGKPRALHLVFPITVGPLTGEFILWTLIDMVYNQVMSNMQ